MPRRCVRRTTCDRSSPACDAIEAGRLYKRQAVRTSAPLGRAQITSGTIAAVPGMDRRVYATAAARTWSALRFGTGMAILSVVFVLSHGLIFVHELAQRSSPTEPA